jgi:uncharacterized membrane protein
MGEIQASTDKETAMTSIVDRTRPRAIHPFPAAALAGSLALFLGALLADYAYWSSYEIQWSNFASWLLIGAMLMASIALLFAIVALIRGTGRFVYFLVLVAVWVVGFFDALHHGRDAWAIMPTALTLSVIVSVLALAATWIGFSSLRAGGAR